MILTNIVKEHFSDVEIIGLIGKQGVGKTFMASKLAEAFKNIGNDVCIMSFATPIQRFLASIGVTKTSYAPTIFNKQEFLQALYSLVPDRELVNMYLSVIFDIYRRVDLTPRARYRLLAQYVGTELGRNFSSNIWINMLRKKLKAINSMLYKPIVIIDDIRFTSEFQVLRDYYKNFILVEVQRPSGTVELNTEHASEQDVPLLINSATYTLVNNEQTIDIVKNKGGDL